MLHEVRRRAWQFDILHFHIDLLHFPVFEHQAQRTVTTLHGRLDLKDLETVPTRIGRSSASFRSPITSARRCRSPTGWPPFRTACRTHQFAFRARPQPGYLAFLGRISPEKRPDVAISIARRAGIPLKIAAKVDDGRSRLLRDAHRTAPRPSADRLHRRDRRRSRSRNFSVTRARCCSRSTGRSRSGS